MRKRNYIVTVSSSGEEETDIFSTSELIFCLVLTIFKNGYELVKVERGEFYD